jgi:hypothetical protein
MNFSRERKREEFFAILESHTSPQKSVYIHRRRRLAGNLRSLLVRFIHSLCEREFSVVCAMHTIITSASPGT